VIAIKLEGHPERKFYPEATHVPECGYRKLTFLLDKTGFPEGRYDVTVKLREDMEAGSSASASSHVLIDNQYDIDEAVA